MTDNILHVIDKATDGPWIYLVCVILVLIFIVTEVVHFRTQHITLSDCGFCTSANGQPVTRVVRRWRWRGVVALETINPVVPGHIVVVSRWHTRDAGENPRLTARVMRCAAELVAEFDAANIITSKGSAATQTAFHLHVHIVPRRFGDNLPLPWTGQVIEDEVSA